MKPPVAFPAALTYRRLAQLRATDGDHPLTLMRTAAYLHVSTAEQDAALQRQGITRFSEHADLNVTDWYCNKGVSGREEKRPGLGDLMEAARQRDIGCVVEGRTGNSLLNHVWTFGMNQFTAHCLWDDDFPIHLGDYLLPPDEHQVTDR